MALLSLLLLLLHVQTTHSADAFKRRRLETINRPIYGSRSMQTKFRPTLDPDSSISIHNNQTNILKENQEENINNDINQTTTTSTNNDTTATLPTDNNAVTLENEQTVNRILQASTFLQVVATALVSFLPAPALVEKLGAHRATSTLSYLMASAAIIEITLSPIVGSMLDSFGRKPAMVLLVLVSTMTNAMVYWQQCSTLSLCVSKFVGALTLGFFPLSTHAIISDIAASNPDRFSSIMGMQMALISGGFLCGAIGAGQLSHLGSPILYGISTIFGLLSALVLSLGLSETLAPEKRVPFKASWKMLLGAPLSCTRILLARGREIRLLSLILILQILPRHMGDYFQIFARTEWGLSTKGFTSLIALLSVIGVTANITGSSLVGRLGNKHFTQLAVLASLIAPTGAVFFGFQGLLIGIVIGFLGSAQSMGIIASLVSNGSQSGVPLGELSGERSALLALLKVIGPVLYSTLHVQGQRLLGINSTPFIFNMLLATGALFLCRTHL